MSLKQFSTEEEPILYFCYLYIRLTPTAIIGFFIAVIGFCLVGYAARQYIQTKRMDMVSRNLKLIYISIFLQLALLLIKLIFSEIIFWVQKQQQETTQMYQYYSIISKYVFVLDITCVFVIQAMLILVCYNWMDKILQIFQSLSNLEDTTQSQKKKTDKFLKFQRVCKGLLKIYLNARFLFFGLLIAFIAVRDQSPENILFKIMLALLLIQVIVVPIILGLGIVAIKRNTKMTDLVGQDETKKMINQYTILIVCTIIRFIIDLVFVIKYFFMEDNTKCFIQKHPDAATYITNVANIFFQGILTHYLPVYVVLSIFKIPKQNVDLSESLLAAEQYQSTSQENQPK